MAEENIFPMINDQCPVGHSTQVINSFDIVLDENIREPAYYRDAFQVLRQAQAGDRVNFFINNSGGRLDTAVCFVNLMKETQAEVYAYLEGDTHSAASIIALNAHMIQVKPYASMMIHHASFGSGGTVQNVMDHVNFTSKQTERLIRDTYKFFLTDTELDEVIRNREIWLTDEEIGERLEIMFEARANEPCDCGQCGIDPEEDFEMPTLDTMIADAVAQGIEQYEKKKADAEKKAARKKPSAKTQKALEQAKMINEAFKESQKSE